MAVALRAFRPQRSFTDPELTFFEVGFSRALSLAAPFSARPVVDAFAASGFLVGHIPSEAVRSLHLQLALPASKEMPCSGW